MRYESEQRDRAFVTAVTLSAVRLMQYAYEEVQHATKLPAHVALMLQLAFNVLREPARAALHLFSYMRY